MAQIYNPPAFPRPLVGSDEAGTVDFGAEGMSLLDYFAGQALAGLTTSRDLLEAGDVARWSYEYADAMLRARAAKAEG